MQSEMEMVMEPATRRADFVAYLNACTEHTNFSYHDFLEIMTTIDRHYEEHIKTPGRLKRYLKQPATYESDYNVTEPEPEPEPEYSGTGYSYPMYYPMYFVPYSSGVPDGPPSEYVWYPPFAAQYFGYSLSYYYPPEPDHPPPTTNKAGYVSASAAAAAASVDAAAASVDAATSSATSSDATATAAKRRTTIETDIQDIGGILRILDAHPYESEVEYNLDLKALHNIRTELRQLDAMVGIRALKCALVDQLLYFIQGLHINTEHDFKHMVIYGPPGTGKTQIAKLIGTMYAKLGILKRQTFRKVTRTDLVAGYLGQTAIKTAKVIDDCLGGCLFIDEVYSLGGGGGDAGGDSYIKECVDTLCEALSDHKEDLMVIVAGYETEVREGFFKMNPGLASRFMWRFTIDEYSAAELMQIFVQKVVENGWDISSVALERWFDKKTFAHFGRDMEQLFCYVKIAHGRRIYGKPDCVRKHLTLADLERGYEVFLKHDSKPAREKMTDSCFGLYV